MGDSRNILICCRCGKRHSKKICINNHLLILFKKKHGIMNKESHKMFYRPYIGRLYEVGVRGKKILVLGASF